MSAQITAAFVYGSVAKETDISSSDIDLMVISDELSYGEIFAVLEEATDALRRPVEPTILLNDAVYGKGISKLQKRAAP